MDISAIRETPPVFTYDAYLPERIDDNETITRSTRRRRDPVVEVRSVRRLGAGVPLARTFSGTGPFGLISDITTVAASDDVRFTLRAPSSAITVGRASPEMRDILTDKSAVIRNPQILAKKASSALGEPR